MKIDYQKSKKERGHFGAKFQAQGIVLCQQFFVSEIYE